VASVFKREVDRRRGAVGKWTGSYRGPDGRWRSFAGSTDKAATQAEANRREAEARLVRVGSAHRHAFNAACPRTRHP